VEVTEHRNNVPCQFDAWWSVATAHETFRGTIRIPDGSYFPLPGGLAKLEYCADILRAADGHLMPPRALLLRDPIPSPAWQSLAEGDVFIPIHEGEASLDQDAYATATIDDPPDATTSASTPSVTIVVVSATQGQSGRYKGLRAGDAFAWGSTRATIVRFAPVDLLTLPRRLRRADGWVEVHLEPAESTQ
jgi:hypothetical protein